MSKTFYWIHIVQYHEYAIYIDGEIFCHVSETNFDTFQLMCVRSGNKILMYPIRERKL